MKQTGRQWLRVGAAAALLAALGLLAVGARAAAQEPPPLPPARRLEPGVLFHEVFLPRPGGRSRLWIYLPERAGGQKVPLVLIAPAGTPMFHGMELGDADRAEHLPYVRAGLGVVAYEIDGPLREDAGDAGGLRGAEAIVTAARAYMQAEAGLANARQALAYARARVPQLDAERLFTAGHSSAGTLSLLVAQHLPGIAGCIAYAPVCYVDERLGVDFLLRFSQVIPGFGDFIQRHSPDAAPQRLRCPVFLFHAADDRNVTTEDIAPFVQELRQTNRQVTFYQVPRGGHYDSMLREGIPAAIEWLRSISAPPPSLRR